MILGLAFSRYRCRQTGKPVDEVGMRVTQDIDFLRGRGATQHESILMDDGMMVHLNEASVKAFFDTRAPSSMVRVRYNAAAFCGDQLRMACDDSYIDKRNQAIAVKNSQRHVKRTIFKNKRSSTRSTALIYEAVTQPPLFDPPGITRRGGASDSAIKQKLAKKVMQAGVQHAHDLIQLVWGDNASELRQLWGSAPEIRAKLLAMARNSDHVLDPGKFFPADPVFEGDPWSKFNGSKAAESTTSSAKSKSTARQAPDSILQIAKFEQQEVAEGITEGDVDDNTFWTLVKEAFPMMKSTHVDAILKRTSII
eukprot:4314958-Amphidinium_carterae.1